jgi:hypothetical protein
MAEFRLVAAPTLVATYSDRAHEEDLNGTKI